MPHEVEREFFRCLLLAEFRRHRLELLDEGVAGVVAGHALGAIVDDRHFPGRIITEPGTDVFGRVRRHVIEADFKQHARLEAVYRLGCRFIEKADARASEEFIVKRLVALDLVDAGDADCCQPILEVLAGSHLSGTVLITAGFHVATFWGARYGCRCLPRSGR